MFPTPFVVVSKLCGDRETRAKLLPTAEEAEAYVQSYRACGYYHVAIFNLVEGTETHNPDAH